MGSRLNTEIREVLKNYVVVERGTSLIVADRAFGLKVLSMMLAA